MNEVLLLNKDYCITKQKLSSIKINDFGLYEVENDSDDVYETNVIINGEKAILNRNKSEMYKKCDTLLKKIDEEYRTTVINFSKYELLENFLCLARCAYRRFGGNNYRKHHVWCVAYDSIQHR